MYSSARTACGTRTGSSPPHRTPPPPPGWSDFFGWSLSLSGDSLIVGAPLAFNPQFGPVGAAYVFTRSGETWTQQQELTSAVAQPNQWFGVSAALVGETAVVGAYLRNGSTGSAFVFTESGGTWDETQELLASNAGSDQFGSAVAFDGTTILIGASGPDFTTGEAPPGAAYVFTDSGGTWTETQELTGAGAPGDQFGFAVALSGATALVGAPQQDVGGVTQQGAVHVFDESGGTWTQVQELTVDDGEDFDQLGQSVALQGDTALIGEWSRNSDPGGEQPAPKPGRAHLFQRSGGTWTRTAGLVPNDSSDQDSFGWSVAVDGPSWMVGATGAAPGGSTFQGAAYAFFEPPLDHGIVEGVVQSRGHCGAVPAPLAGATVEIAGTGSTVTLQAEENGYYQAALPGSESPIDITVSAPGHLPSTVEGIVFGAGETVVQDLELDLEAPCLTADPDDLTAELEPGQSTVETLTIGNTGGNADLEWTITAVDPPAAGEAPARHEMSAGGAEPLLAVAPTPRGLGTADTEGFPALPHVSPLAAARDLASALHPLPGVRPIDAMGGVVNCDGEPGLIAHDDGSVENAYSSNTALVSFADRFTPPAYPAPLAAVCVAFLTLGPTSLDFEIVVLDDDGAEGGPSTELGALPASADGIPGTPGTPAWFAFDISSLGISIESGSVYIGARWAPANPGVFIAADESPAQPVGFAGGYWWNDVANVWSPIESAFFQYRSLFVRAVVNPAGCNDPGDISWLSLDPPSGLTPAGGSSEVEVSLDASGLSSGVYEANLCIASNDPMRPLVVVPVTLTVQGAGAPVLALDPPSLDFGDVEVGTASSPQVATLSNTGDAAATGLTVTIDPSGSDFAADASACGDILPAGESCFVDVTFTPLEPGPASATLRVSGDEGAPAEAGLSGNGVGDEGFTAMALTVDMDEIVSDGNRVFEPGESADVAPAWRNDGTVAESLAGTASDFTGPEGAGYTLEAADADYGLIEPGETASCLDTEVCYRLGVDDPAVRPATHWEATFDETLDDIEGTTKTWTLHIGDSFVDVPSSNPFYAYVETLLHSGVTGGCTDTEYCPTASNTRDQMPVFVLRAVEGADYEPPACVEGAEVFHDVPASNAFCPWIEELANRDVVNGCGGDNYCPNVPVTRAQMAIFLLRSLEGSDYTPPACTGQFVDVPCPSLFADWIEDLFARQITGGCSSEPMRYCPANPVNREQMAVFVTKAFGLTLYGP